LQLRRVKIKYTLASYSDYNQLNMKTTVAVIKITLHVATGPIGSAGILQTAEQTAEPGQISGAVT
jgi:hypothetical protein